MARANAHIGTTNFATTIRMGGGRTLVADEPAALGGADAGPAPYDLLLASLGACTAITLRMYAERKQWSLQAVDIDLHHVKVENRSKIERVITLTGDLSADQRARLADIAERTPVTLTLKAGADIATRLSDG
ncbi:OsmC family protein [Bosea sp. BIWAKO-01]|uniref:OsmC family protein n=1 Tax=Bosea sp. BIWAKO-01 TaxID=506668 RepID=UPI000852E0D3|nr:OsmC family protein [Bosea sp. BIWAKO-01]